jgi:hypothetical protein
MVSDQVFLVAAGRKMVSDQVFLVAAGADELSSG